MCTAHAYIVHGVASIHCMHMQLCCRSGAGDCRSGAGDCHSGAKGVKARKQVVHKLKRRLDTV